MGKIDIESDVGEAGEFLAKDDVEADWYKMGKEAQGKTMIGEAGSIHNRQTRNIAILRAFPFVLLSRSSYLGTDERS